MSGAITGFLGGLRSWFSPVEAIVEAQPSDRPVEADPAKEYAVVRGGAELLPWDAARLAGLNCGPQPAAVLRQVAKLPAAQAALYALKSLILSGNFEWTPAISGDGESPERIAAAKEAVAECERAMARLTLPLEQVAWEMLEAVVERNTLAEIVMADDPEAGGLTLRAIKPKPQWAYRYRVDGPMNVVGIDVWDGEAWVTLDPDKFTWLTFDGRHGVPTGQSILDGAMPYVNILVQTWPEFYTWLTQFARPRTVAIEGPRAEKQKTLPGGKIVEGVKYLASTVAATLGGGTVGVPEGTDVKLLESLRDGKALIEAIKLLEGQVTKCVLLAVQTLVEAEHASRADSDSKKGLTEGFAAFLGPHWLCAAMRKPFVRMLAANHGEAWAREFAPLLSTGRVNAEAMARVAQAVGVLYQAGFFTEAQLVWLDDFIGLPRRSAGEPRVGPQRDNRGASAELANTDPAPAGGATDR